MGFPDRATDYNGSYEHLTNFAQAFGNGLSKEVDLIAPVIQTADLNFEYGEWSKKSGHQNPGMTIRKPGTTAKEFKTEYSVKQDKIIGYAGRIKVPRLEQATFNKKSSKTLIEVKTEQMTRFAYDDRRLALAALIVSTSCTYTAAAHEHWDASSSTEIFQTDINAAVNSVIDQAGRNPNTIFMPRKVWRALRNNSEFVDRYKYWAETIKTAAPIDMIEDMKLVVMDGVIDANQKGQTASLGSIWSDSCWVAYIEQSPDPYSLTALSTFRPEYANDIQVKSYYDEEIDSDWVEYNFLEKIKLINQECLYCISDCLT